MGNTSRKHTFSPILFVKSLFSFLALLLFTDEPRPFFLTLDHHQPSPSLLLFLFFGQHHHLISSQAFSITIAIDSLLWVSPPPSPSIIFTVSFSHSSKDRHLHLPLFSLIVFSTTRNLPRLNRLALMLQLFLWSTPSSSSTKASFLSVGAFLHQ